MASLEMRVGRSRLPTRFGALLDREKVEAMKTAHSEAEEIRAVVDPVAIEETRKVIQLWDKVRPVLQFPSELVEVDRRRISREISATP